MKVKGKKENGERMIKMCFINLYTGYNKAENFRILICAFDKTEAKKLADEYRCDSNMKGEFEITKSDSIDDVHFDCDYVIA